MQLISNFILASSFVRLLLTTVFLASCAIFVGSLGKFQKVLRKLSDTTTLPAPAGS